MIFKATTYITPWLENGSGRQSPFTYMLIKGTNEKRGAVLQSQKY